MKSNIKYSRSVFRAYSIQATRMALVQVSEGLLQGQLVDNVYGGSFYSFKGIPFAAPPIDDRRFKAPEPPQPWKGTRNATEFGSVCYQGNVNQRSQTGSEDCLFLNVYTPNIKPETLLPVMIWIHGGAFFFGSGNDDLYGPEFLVRLGVILVTFNYRLEALGFLSLNTKDVPGNAGMKDQVAAMKWVKNNIKAFGGDPDNITIFGESAGAGSVSYHLISPMTKGLFKRAIMQSGAATSYTHQAFEPRERARLVAKRFGNDTDDDDELYQFFKSLPAHVLVNLNDPLTYNEAKNPILHLDYAVTDEVQFGDQERYFYGSVDEALRNSVHEDIDILSGYVEHEGLVSFMLGDSLTDIVSQINQFPEVMTPRSIALNSPIKDQIKVGKRLKEFYFGNKTVTNNDKYQVTAFLGTELFKFRVFEWANICSQKNTNYYFYTFTRKSERNLFKDLFSIDWLFENDNVTSHLDDLAFLFPIKLANKAVDINSDTFKYIEEVSTLWTNFAKYGNPTPVNNTLGVVWPRYDAQKQQYLDIGQQLSPATYPDKEEMQLWTEIHNQHYYKSL